jgi:hypothetical protein
LRCPLGSEFNTPTEIDRLLVQPLASLIASKQVRGGDVLSIDHEAGAEGMKFLRTGERVVLAEAA